MFLSDEGPTLETLDFAFHIGSTPTFLYFDLYTAPIRCCTIRLFYIQLGTCIMNTKPV